MKKFLLNIPMLMILTSCSNSSFDYANPKLDEVLIKKLDRGECESYTFGKVKYANPKICSF